MFVYLACFLFTKVSCLFILVSCLFTLDSSLEWSLARHLAVIYCITKTNIWLAQQYPQIAQEVENDEEFEDMLNMDQNVEESGVTSDIVFRYFHLLEKVSYERKVKAVRPFQFMSEPVKRKNVILKHKLALKDYEDSLPQSYFENVDVILALVVMELNRK